MALPAIQILLDRVPVLGASGAGVRLGKPLIAGRFGNWLVAEKYLVAAVERIAEAE